MRIQIMTITIVLCWVLAEGLPAQIGPGVFTGLSMPAPYISELQVLLDKLRDVDVNERGSACNSVAQYGLPAEWEGDAVPLLLAAAGDADVKLRGQAVAALGVCRREEARRAVIAALADPATEVIRAAIRVLSGKMRDPAAVKPLADLLHGADAELRQSAAYALLRQGEPGEAALRAALAGGEAEVRLTAVQVLGRQGTLTQRQAVLAPALRDADRQVRKAAVILLGECGSRRVLPDLLPACAYAEREVRMAAVSALGWLPGEETAPPLLRALRDDDQGVRLAAIEALGETRQPAAVEPLLEMLGDKDARLAAAACRALAKIPAAWLRAGSALSKVLDNPEMTARRDAAAALRYCRDPRAIEALVAMTEEERELEPRLEAALTLAYYGDDRALPPLLDMLKPTVAVFVHSRVIEALGELGDTRAVEPLCAILADPRPSSLREKAITLLSKLKDPRAIPLLCELAAKPYHYAVTRMPGGGYSYSSGNDREHLAAIATLGEFNDPAAVPALIQAMSSGAPALRAAALPVLRRMKADAEPALAEAARSDDASLRAAGVYGLLMLAPERTEEFKAAAADPEYTVRQAFAWTQAGNPRGWRWLAPLATDPEYQVSSIAIYALGEQTDPHAIAALAPVLASTERGLLQTVILALGKQKLPEAAPVLLQALEGEDTGLHPLVYEALSGFTDARVADAFAERIDGPERLHALRALAGLRDPRALEPLLAMLAERKPESYWTAASLLGSYLQPRVVAALVETLNTAEEPVVEAAAFSLGVIGGDQAREALLAALRERHIPAAADALARIGGKEAEDAILDALEDGVEPQRLITLLGKMKTDNPRAILLLTDMLRNHNVYIRMQAIDALGSLRVRQAALPLIARLTDTEPAARRKAAAALAAITGEDYGEDAGKWLMWWEAEEK